MKLIKRFNHTLSTSLFTIIEDNLPKLPKKIYKLEEILDKYRKINSEHQVLRDLYKNSEKLSLDIDYIKLTNQQFQLCKDLQSLLIKAYKSSDNHNQDFTLHSNMLYFEEPHKPITLEIIPGSGGQEAKIFSEQLFQMYCNISTMKGWKLDIIDETCATIEGNNVLKILSYETGIHRVQRIPETEKKGRMQTSSAAVTILPKENVSSVVFNKESDLLIETMRSSGHGGQSVNKSETAVRITHLPTGISVTMKEASGQIENKNLALKALANKLEERERKSINLKAMNLKCKQTGNLDRSEKIRTFNFEHDRVTDHRCNISLNDVEDFLKGNDDFDIFHETLSNIDDERVSNYVANNLQLFYELIK